MRNKTTQLPDDQRLSLIDKLFAQWSTTKYFPVRTMRQALTPNEWTQYQDQITRQRPPPMPLEIALPFKRYTDCLRRADNLDKRSRRTPGDSRREYAYMGLYPKKPLRQRAEIEYSRAYEILEEIFGDFPGAGIWMDRPVYFDQARGFDVTAAAVPRLLSSRSPYVLGNGRPKSRSGAAFDSLTTSRERIMDKLAQAEALAPAATILQVRPYRGICSIILPDDE